MSTNQPIKKANVDKLRRNRQPTAKSTTRDTEVEEPVAQSRVEKGDSGFEVGQQRRTQRKNFMLDHATIESIDDLSYTYKKRWGQRMSESHIVRTAFRLFRKLPLEQQLQALSE